MVVTVDLGFLDASGFLTPPFATEVAVEFASLTAVWVRLALAFPCGTMDVQLANITRITKTAIKRPFITIYRLTSNQNANGRLAGRGGRKSSDERKKI
jgi:hypothetical protein